MENPEIVSNREGLKVVLPLTQPTGKIRVKRRNAFNEYGQPVATRQLPLSQCDYVEWQIGYDLEVDKAIGTSLESIRFINNAGKEKCPYELSELILSAHRAGFIREDTIGKLAKDILSVPERELLDKQDLMQIQRQNPRLETINGLEFHYMKVMYPMIVRRFGNYDICTEIIVREKQRAVGIQPMLFLCLPILCLKFGNQPIGRILEQKEKATWNIGVVEAGLVVELFRMFGMLSQRHRSDVTAILKALFPSILG